MGIPFGRIFALKKIFSLGSGDVTKKVWVTPEDTHTGRVTPLWTKMLFLGIIP